MGTDCRVWTMYQARCLLCEWSSDILTGDPGEAAGEARYHRQTPEHRKRLRGRRNRRRRS
jgi:hypothetical protein